jgi:hypothetical protein
MLTTCKQFGDSSERLVADKLTAAGTSTVLCPVNHPGFDLVTLAHGKALTVQVKARHPSHPHPAFRFAANGFDWLALVRVEHDAPRIWLLPREVALAVSTSLRNGMRRISHASLLNELRQWEDNFALNPTGSA